MVALAALGAFAPSALAGVSAFRVADGSSDPAFVRLGDATTIHSVVPDGAHGAYLIGSIAYGGSGHRIVHMRADGSVDPAFRAQITGGYAVAGAVSHGRLAVVGAFTAVDGQPRRGLAVLDARTGRPFSWVPSRPRAARMDSASRVVYAGGMLVASTRAGIFAWRAKGPAAVWKRALVQTTEPVEPASVVVWHGAVWAITGTRETGDRLISLDPATGRITVSSFDVSHVAGIDQVGGRLILYGEGDILELGADAASATRPECERAVSRRGNVVTAVGGDARTLYLGVGPITLDAPGTVIGLVACTTGAGVSAFVPPRFSYGVRGPIVRNVALIGTHVLVFTSRF